MDQDYKVLAQFAPFAATDTDLYTVPAATQTVISTIVITNRSATDTATYRVAVIPATQELEGKHYIVFNTPLVARDSMTLTAGITLSAGDKIMVRSSSADFSFSLFGVEFS
jgi:hypothetical protein